MMNTLSVSFTTISILFLFEENRKGKVEELSIVKELDVFYHFTRSQFEMSKEEDLRGPFSCRDKTLIFYLKSLFSRLNPLAISVMSFSVL